MAHLSIGALGALRVTLDGQAITSLAYDKVWALLVYLAQAADHSHRRQTLAGLLWPDHPETVARTSLRQALARLRQAIGDHGATPPFLFIHRTRIQFNAASDAELDVTAFTALLAACDTHAHRHTETCLTCAERRAQAVALYRGAFLDQFSLADSDLYEEWATLERERLHQRALQALAALVAYHERRGDYAQALRYGERQLDLDPWREEAYRQVMRMLALSGRCSEALMRYERCCAILETELGVAPAAETTVLAERIRAGELQAAVTTDALAPAPRSHPLPLSPTPFVGRAQELAALADLLADPECRLISLVGPGGIGKTRLALQAASEASEAFADGTAFVSLAPLTGEFIVPSVAGALQFTLDDRAAPQAQLLAYLRRQELLLVLDNFEHLLAPANQRQGGNEERCASELVSEILHKAPGVTLLVTSRERLNVQGEWVYDVGGLDSPPATTDVLPSLVERDAEPGDAPFEAYSAVALFLQTARRMQANFTPTVADKAAIVRICRLVQGMPLALELAASWVRVLSCVEIAGEIETSLGFLTTGLRDVPGRHRSLQAVFDHSWKLLSADEQRVFAQCSVFRGGFTREAAARVAGASLPALAALVDKSWLRWNLNGRYEVHELARQYAATRLAESQQAMKTCNHHLAFFMKFAEAAEPHLRSGPQAAQWFDQVEIEYDNLRAALEWSWHGGKFEHGFRIVGALWEFWMNRGYTREGQSQAERFLARAEAAAPTYERAKALHTAGVLAFWQGRLQAASSWFGEGLAISRELGSDGRPVLALALIGQSYAQARLGNVEARLALSQECLALGHELQDAWVRGHALLQLGYLDKDRGDDSSAQKRHLESFECFEADGHSVMRGIPLLRLGDMLAEQGDYVAAHTYYTRSLAIFEELGDPVRSSLALLHLGNLATVQSHNTQAQELLSRALMLIRKSGHLRNQGDILDAMGRLAQRQGDYKRSHALYRESLTVCLEVDDPARIARALEAFACLRAEQGQLEVAARLFAAAEVRFDAIELRFMPALSSEHQHWAQIVRAQLGEAAFATAWAAGAAMTLDQAMTLTKATNA